MTSSSSSPNALVVLLLAATMASSSGENPLKHIGTPNIDVLKFSYDTVIEETANKDECTYTVTMSFDHEESFPFGELGNTCKVDVIAEDGLPYFAHRWYYQRYDYATQLATGFAHVSLDWNACGHPGFGFQTPHYDMHIYTVTPEFRATNMACDKIYGTPTCKPESDQTGSGKGYYVFGEVAETRQLDNLPADYTWELTAAIEYMGTHGGNPNREPRHHTNWTDPLLYFTSFNGAICSFEPMFPYGYVSGDEDQFHEETVEYEVKTLVTLPHYWSITYDKDTGYTTIVMKGPSALCKADFEEARKTGRPGENPPSVADSAAARPFAFGMALFAVLGYMLLTTLSW